jgi:hypothetical protein
MSEQVLNLGQDAQVEPAFVSRAADPVVSNVGTPADFAAQFPTPLDTTELVAMCEEINLWRALPEQPTGLKTYSWREMTSLAFTSGSIYINFADGECPDEYKHDGANKSIDLKNIGAKKSLTISDIMHSFASQAAGYGIRDMASGFAAGEGMPGGSDMGAGMLGAIAGLKAKEMQLGGTLVMNGWDNLLAAGDATSNPLAFDGITYQVTSANGAHANSATDASGTFAAQGFDRFLSEGCAKPTHIFGHPQAIQEMLLAYFTLGFQGSQVINATSGDRIVPGFNFAGEVFTGVGRLVVVADANLPKTDLTNGTFRAKLFPLRMTHNGKQLVYKITQIPLAFKDLAPGCTSVSFQIWAKTALIIEAMCAQSVYTKVFTGNSPTTCTRIGI